MILLESPDRGPVGEGEGIIGAGGRSPEEGGGLACEEAGSIVGGWVVELVENGIRMPGSEDPAAALAVGRAVL